MNRASVIAYQRGALLRVLAVLFSSIGLKADIVVAVLTREMRNSVLRVLRPAEAAARRLIVAEAEGLEAEEVVKRITSSVGKSRVSSGCLTTFPLFDPRRKLGPHLRRRKKGLEPQIRFLDGYDPPYQAWQEDEPPSPDEKLDSGRLCQRLHSLKVALEDIPAQARRLVRLQARRKQIPRLRLKGPLRVGRPPGHRARGTHEVDEILRECEILARRALVPPDI